MSPCCKKNCTNCHPDLHFEGVGGHFGRRRMGFQRRVFSEVEILMAKRVKRNLAGVAGTWQELAALGGNLGARPLKNYVEGPQG